MAGVIGLMIMRGRGDAHTRRPPPDPSSSRRPQAPPEPPAGAPAEPPASSLDQPPASSLDQPAAPPTPPAAVAALELRLAPRDARVRHRRHQSSRTAGLAVHSLAPGRHELRVDARGHRPHRRTIDVVAGETLSIEVRLEATSRPSRPSRRGKRPPRAAPLNPDGTIDPFE